MKRNRMSLILISILVLFSVSITASAINKVKTVGISVNLPTQSQIIQFVKNHPVLAGTNNKVTYDSVPSIKNPFSAGKVSAKHLNDGLNALNIIRYIAGIPANVALDDDYCTYAQAGAVINAANNELDHTPQKPAGMADDLYNTGYTGTSSGNISYGMSLISDTVISGYMEDGDSSNISRLGHRRWILNPPMESTGFGYAPNKFSVMYAFDNSDGLVEDKYAVTAWPAQNMPIEYFGKVYPFSISLSADFDNLIRNNIKIKMTRLSDGKIFNFNAQTSNSASSQTYFDINNDGYGQPHCIIWRPDISGYAKGGSPCLNN